MRLNGLRLEMSLRKKLFLITIIFPLIGGCVPRSYNYYYISLENLDEANVLKIETVDLEGLKASSPIPVEYEIKRKNYSLMLTVIERSYYPNFDINVVGEGRLKLIHRRDPKIFGKMCEICASFEQDPKNPSNLFFAWSSNCREDSIDKVISFDVFGENGHLIGSEDIPFILKNNGKYRLIDSL